jgi:uncharacterized membrane protein required for colicin V production
VAVDLAVVALLLIATLHGWRRGLLAQAIGLGGVVAVWLVAPRLVAPVRAWLLEHGQPAGLALELTSLAVAVGVVLALVWLAGTMIPDAARSLSPGLGRLDRGLGAGLGLARGGLLIWLLLATAAWAEQALVEAVPPLRQPLRESQSVAAARTWNVWRLIDRRRLEALRRQLADAAAPRVETPKLLLELSQDEGLRDAAAAGAVEALLRDPRVVALLLDEDALPPAPAAAPAAAPGAPASPALARPTQARPGRPAPPTP